MKRALAMAALAALLLGGCAHTFEYGWTTLINNGKGFYSFNRIGDANWRSEDDAIVADKGKGGFLVTRKSFRNFELHAEFWADHTTNSGIFLRAQDPHKVGADNAYEVNIFDQRPGQEYSTGAIVGFAQLRGPPPKAGGQWNTFEIYANGPELVIKLNGVVTVATSNSRFREGPIALQFGNGANGKPGGAIKWRRMLIRAI